MRKLHHHAATLVAAAAIGFAATGAVEAQSRSDTRLYAGIALSFGAAAQPGAGAVIGVQAIRVNARNRLRGLDLNARYDLRRGFDRIALAGLIGRRGGYLNLGGGVNPATGEVFVTGAAQASHLRAGVDYGMVTGSAGGYFELNTLRRPGRYVPPVPAPDPAPNGNGAPVL